MYDKQKLIKWISTRVYQRKDQNVSLELEAIESISAPGLHVEGWRWTMDKAECGVEESRVTSIDKKNPMWYLRREYYGKSVFG